MVSSAIDHETCRACGFGFGVGVERLHNSNGWTYHKECFDGAMEYERGKRHGADDLRMSQQHCQSLQLQLDERSAQLGKIKMELHRLAKELGARGLVDLADDLRLAARG